MNRDKFKDLFLIIVVGIVFIAVTVLCFTHTPEDFSLSERRKLAVMPELTWQNVSSGKFMKDFGTYSQDQFPYREFNRKIAAVFSTNILGKSDNHDIYSVNGSLAKLDYPLNEDSVMYAAKRFGDVYDKYIKETGDPVYLSVIPDKGYFLSSQYPTMDYIKLAELLATNMPYASYIDIYDTLSADSYYLTDPHWRQEKIEASAETIASAMGKGISDNFTIKTLDVKYAGNYAGQSAMPVKPESISYISNASIENAIVNNLESNTTGGVYDYERAYGRDPYEFYLSGPVSLLTITQAKENTVSGSRVIIFRDSFGSSIAPYFIEAYDEIILVDIRYLAPEYLGRFVDFSNADVLFLYSASVLNHSETIK